MNTLEGTETGSLGLLSIKRKVQVQSEPALFFVKRGELAFIEKLEALDILEALEALEALDILEALEPLEELEPLEPLEALEELEPLEKLEPLAPYRLRAFRPFPYSFFK